MTFALSNGFVGTRVSYNWAAKSAWYCASIKTPPGFYGGAVLGYYVVSSDIYYGEKGPSGAWDELDYELMLKNGKLWLNAWHGGRVVPGQEGYNPHPSFSRTTASTATASTGTCRRRSPRGLWMAR